MTEFSIGYQRMQYLQIAMEQAKKSIVRFKHGAVIVKKGKIVSLGHNKYCFSCYAIHKICIHAEINAIANCPTKYLSGATLYVIRLNESGELKYSKPCQRCKDYIIRSKISYVYYS